MYICLHVKYRLFSSYFNEIGIFWADFLKILKISNFTEIRPVGAELFHAYRQIGRAGIHDEANILPQSFEIALKIHENSVTKWTAKYV